MILEWLKKLFGKKRGYGFLPEEQDERDFVLLGSEEILGAWSYIPKSQKKVIKTLEIKNQAGQNTCVTESISCQKEPDEGMLLDPQDLAIFLRSTGDMSSKGTSLSAAQSALQTRGVAEKGYLPNKYNTWWEDFSNPKLMTEEIKQNAAIHKSKSYYKTYSLDKVLEELDNNRIGHTGLTWKTGYGENYPYILEPNLGSNIFGHAFAAIGYNMNYNGEKVLIFQNSFGKDWGDSGKFYLRFKDFSILKWGVYFNSDLDKDKIGWLSIHQAQAVKELGGPKIYLIQGEVKRHIPNEVILHLLGRTTTFLEDKENILSDIKEADPVGIKDISTDRFKQVEEEIRLLNSANFINDALKEKYREIFPTLF
ncbi:MAG: C1 family peptidase [Patescibacteria group bacterium]